MQAFQWHGRPSLDGHEAGVQQGWRSFVFIWIFLFAVLENCNVSSHPRPGCTGTFLDGEKQNTRRRMIFSQLRFSRFGQAGGTADTRRGIEYRPSIKLPRPSDGDCGTLVLGGMLMRHGLSISHVTAHVVRENRWK